VKPEISLLGLELKTFGICFGLAFLASGAVVGRRLVELGRPVDWSYEMVFAALVGGLVGSRVYWLIQHPGELTDAGSVFGGSGLVWYGGLLGGALGVTAWAWRRNMLGVGLLDLCAPALAIGYAIGRIGCQVSGDGDYGSPTDLPWGMAYPDGVVPTTVDVHPTPIYETVAMGLLAWILWRHRDQLKPGLLFACYLLGAGTERFLVEFVRRNDEVVLGLTAAQLESLGLMAAGATWLVLASRRGPLRREDAPVSEAPRAPRSATA
jgi:phosphatidylglycerol:prolipoprotein diacylglycerol transferase